MTAIARLTRAEVRKLATTRAFLITLAVAVGLAVIAVVVDAAEVRGLNGLSGAQLSEAWVPNVLVD